MPAQNASHIEAGGHTHKFEHFDYLKRLLAIELKISWKNFLTFFEIFFSGLRSNG